MLKLLNQNFYKLKKDKIFWLINISSFALAIFAIFRYQTLKDTITLDRIVTEYMSMYLGIFIAFFITTFVGREYTEGTIRNKIISGHKRVNIYLANLIVCIIAGVIAEIIYISTVFLIGKNIYGPLQMMSLFRIMLYTVLIIVVYCSIYNLMTMLCADVSMALVTCVIIFGAIFVTNGIVRQKLYISQYTTVTSYDENGEIQSEKKLNEYYPSESEIELNKTIYFWIPMGQADIVQTACSEMSEYDEEQINKRKEYIAQMPIYATILIVISNIGGLLLFNKQELK